MLAVNIADSKMWIGNASDDPVAIGGEGGVSFVATALPASPQDNTFWWHSNLGKMFFRYNDGSSAQWVEVGPGGL